MQRRPARGQQEPLLAVEADLRTLARRAVHAHIRDALEPELSLVIKIGIVQERPAVDEIAPEVADRVLDFALRMRAIGPTGAWRDAPVMREANKLRIAHERARLPAAGPV